jgi:recombination protein RecR
MKNSLPKPVLDLIEKLENLPGIGPKSAERLVFYLLHNPLAELEDLAHKLVALKKETVLCSNCHHISQKDPCEFCSDQERDQNIICVVEQPLDLIALEKAKKYKGLYHVLHGKIDPLNNIGPEQIFLYDLITRLKKNPEIKELVLATNSSMEGETTAFYIKELIKKDENLSYIKITRLGYGLPIGADIEYADDLTLGHALETRREF